jgi:SAM-dependent methyltransferase
VRTASAGLLDDCVRRTEPGEIALDASVTCRWCGGRSLRVVRHRGDHRVMRCERCDFLTLKTGLDESQLGASYQEYLPTEPAAIARWEREQRPVVARAVRAIRSLVAASPSRSDSSSSSRAVAPRLLEIGSGFGFFLKAARDAGFDVHGLEFSANGRAHARAAFGLDVSDVPFERSGLAASSFDVVCAFYVVEHLADPRAFLLEAARLLAPGGLLFLRWPHTTPLARLLDALHVRHDLYHAPWHLSDFTPSTMERALRDSGFERVRTRTFGGTAVGGGAKSIGSLVSRGAAAASDLIELASGARLHVPGVSKTTFGFKAAS